MATTQYIHSRIVTSIIDNSIVEEQVTVPIEFVLFQPYFSEEGEDNQAMWLKEFYSAIFEDHPLVTAITNWDYGDGAWLNAPSGFMTCPVEPSVVVMLITIPRNSSWLSPVVLM